MNMQQVAPTAALAVVALAVGAGLGVLAPRPAPDACLQALAQHEAQYQLLEGALPVAADAVQAAARRSASALNDATARLATIQAQRKAAEGPLQQVSNECRGSK